MLVCLLGGLEGRLDGCGGRGWGGRFVFKVLKVCLNDSTGQHSILFTGIDFSFPLGCDECSRS